MSQIVQKVEFLNQLINLINMQIFLMQRMLSHKEENVFPPRFLNDTHLTLTATEGFGQRPRNLRKSLGSIPFRKIGIQKANNTQVLTRRNSIARPVKKQKLNDEQLPIVRNVDKNSAQKSTYFDQFLSDIEMLKDYKMMSHIGKGCFSTVSLAVHKQSNKAYAIKTYEKIDILQWPRLESIKRQIKHLKRLQHENVIQLFHVFKDKKKILLLMDNGGKQSLSGLLRKNHFFTEEKAKFYFKQIIKAVSYCHSRGVCHRDIKPENILVDDEGNVKIIDFGFSANTSSKLTTYCGTPPFMCPQITKKVPYSGAGADMWALGVMLYQLVVGTLPFRATNEQELYRLIQQGKYPVRENMSKNLKLILNRMLNCDANKRASAESILSDPWLQ